MTLGVFSRLRLKCDVTRAETRFRLSRETERVHLNRPVGTSVQSTAGSRGVRISGSNAGYTMFRGSVKSTGYSLDSPVSPSLPLPCVTVCHHMSTAVYRRIPSTELKSDTSVVLIRHLHPVLSLRTSVATPPFLPNTFMTLCLIKQREFCTLLDCTRENCVAYVWQDKSFDTGTARGCAEWIHPA